MSSILALTGLDRVFTKANLRRALYVLLVVIIAIILWIGAAITYSAIYHWYIPYDQSEARISIDFSYLGNGAYATLDLSNVPRLSSFVDYDVALKLVLPRSEKNKEIGNFMSRITMIKNLPQFLKNNPLRSPDDPSIHAGDITRWPITYHSTFLLDNAVSNNQIVMCTRSAILPFRTELLEILDTLLFSPLYLFGWMSQTSTVVLEMTQIAPDATHLFVELDRIVEIADASIIFKVRWEGLRYLLYHHRIIAFIAGTSIFWFIELTATLAATLLILSCVSSRNSPVKVSHLPDKKQHTISKSNEPGTFGDEVDESRTTKPLPQIPSSASVVSPEIKTKTNSLVKRQVQKRHSESPGGSPTRPATFDEEPGVVRGFEPRSGSHAPASTKISSHDISDDQTPPAILSRASSESTSVGKIPTPEATPEPESPSQSYAEEGSELSTLDIADTTLATTVTSEETDKT